MHLLIAAAGSGRRMGADRNKLLLPLAGRPVLAWTLQAALACPEMDWIGVVGQPHDADAITAIIAAAKPDRPVRWILGGETRQESVSCGLAALPADAEAAAALSRARFMGRVDAVRLTERGAAERWRVVRDAMGWARTMTRCRHERRGLAGAWACAVRAALVVALASGCAEATRKPALATACSVARVACGVVESACAATTGGEGVP